MQYISIIQESAVKQIVFLLAFAIVTNSMRKCSFDVSLHSVIKYKTPIDIYTRVWVQIKLKYQPYILQALQWSLLTFNAF